MTISKKVSLSHRSPFTGEPIKNVTMLRKIFEDYRSQLILELKEADSFAREKFNEVSLSVDSLSGAGGGRWFSVSYEGTFDEFGQPRAYQKMRLITAQNGLRWREGAKKEDAFWGIVEHFATTGQLP